MFSYDFPLPLQYTLAIEIVGNVNNKVESTAPDQGINCVKGSLGGCSASYDPGTTVTLTATVSNSSFDSWSGLLDDKNRNPYNFTMDGNKTVTASFTPDKAKIRIGSDPTAFYTLDAALAAAPTPELPALATEIRAQSLLTVFSEDIIMTNPISILLKGGYDTDFTNQAGYTTVRGSLRIRGGKLLVERLNIKGL